MDTKSKTKATTAAAPCRAPLKVLRIDDVSVSVFARDRKINGNDVTFYSASFSRSYKDSDGTRKYTSSLDEEDLGKVMTLAKQAGEFITEMHAAKAA